MAISVIENSGIAVVVVAAGRGFRAGGSVPKQYRMVAGKPVLAHTLARIGAALPGAELVCVIHPDDRALYDTAVTGLELQAMALHGPVDGGPSRQHSVLAGLKAISNFNKDIKIVLIHDSVRMFTCYNLIHDLVGAARESGAAVPGFPVPDALKLASDGHIKHQLPRDRIFAVQTPQAFRFDLILEAHLRAAAAEHADFDDDAAVAEWAGHMVTIVPSDRANFKLTTEVDFRLAEAIAMADLADIRIGTGFDVHIFADGDGVWLGGIKVPFHRTLAGHSDADVVLHALTDAVLGAIGDGDIGSHFPPSDPQWKGAASDMFLRHGAALVARRGGIIAHLDVTVIAEAPKVSPHREAMRASIAAIAGITPDRVSVKATTTEKLGFTGRGEGIAAQAVATVRLPLSPGTDNAA